MCGTDRQAVVPRCHVSVHFRKRVLASRNGWKEQFCDEQQIEVNLDDRKQECAEES